MMQTSYPVNQQIDKIVKEYTVECKPDDIAEVGEGMQNEGKTDWISAITCNVDVLHVLTTCGNTVPPIPVESIQTGQREDEVISRIITYNIITI